jgi:sugar phosphate isomerase/epimerase
VSNAGFAGIDLMGASLKGNIAEAKAALAETGLRPATVYGQLGKAGTSLVDQTAAERAQSLDLFKERLEATAEVGADKMIFVPRFGDPALRPEALEWVLITMLDELAEWAKDMSVTLVMEPLNKGETRFVYDPLVALRIVKTVNSPRVQSMVDTYHMAVENQDMVERIRQTGEHLAIVHLSDTSRALPGQGQIDFATVLRTVKEIGYEGPMGFECKAAAEEDLRKSVNFLNDIMASFH